MQNSQLAWRRKQPIRRNTKQTQTSVPIPAKAPREVMSKPLIILSMHASYVHRCFCLSLTTFSFSSSPSFVSKEGTRSADANKHLRSITSLHRQQVHTSKGSSLEAPCSTLSMYSCISFGPKPSKGSSSPSTKLLPARMALAASSFFASLSSSTCARIEQKCCT